MAGILARFREARLIIRVAACAALLASASLRAETFLPDSDAVIAAIERRAEVAAAAERVRSARAEARALAVGPNEYELSAIPQRRRIERETSYTEWEYQLGRRFRLPGKAALDRNIGRHTEVSAAIRQEESRHDAAVRLLELWMSWVRSVVAEERTREQLTSLEQARDAIARRAQLGDAARLEVDLLNAEAAEAAVAHTEHALARVSAEVALTQEFPELPLPTRPPQLPEPVALEGSGDGWIERIVEHDHTLRGVQEEVARQELVAQRARADRIPDPTLGVRILDENGGAERTVGFVFSVPIGMANRGALADAARADANAMRRDVQALRRDTEVRARLLVLQARHAIEQWQARHRAYVSSSAAAARMRRAWELGEADISERLLAERRHREATLEEQRMRAEALEAIARVRIDGHDLWSEAVESGGPTDR